MNCKFCQKPLPEDTSVCPSCGKDNAEEITTAVASEDTVVEATGIPADEEPQPESTPADEEPQAESTPADEEPQAPDIPEDTEEQPTDPSAAEDAAAAEPPKKRRGKLVLTIVLGVLAAIVVAILAYYSVYAISHRDDASFGQNLKDATTQAINWITGKETPDTNTVAAKAVYTDDSVTTQDKRMSKVVATCGDLELTNGEFQIYYFMQYYNFLNSYGSYASMFGLDTSSPLSEQTSLSEDLTWEQYFVDAAMQMFKENAAVYTEAKAAGFALDEETQAQIDNLEASLEEEATYYGFESALDYVQQSFGVGCTIEDYIHFISVYYYVGYYEQSIYDGLTYTEDDINAYYDQNAETYEASGITKTDLNDVNVRHILIAPETSAEDGTSTEEDLAAAKAKAEELLAQFQEDPSEENFATLANENSDDTGSNTNGGLYENVYPGQMYTNFNDWCFDASRQPGDVGIVETDAGYHIIYFVGTTDTYYWYTYTESQYKNDMTSAAITELTEKYDCSIKYRTVVLAPLPEAESSDTTDTTDVADTTASPS